MTNEEAAKILKLERDSWRENPKLKVDQRLYDAVDVAIKELEACWIHVSEKLPEKNGEYLVTVSSFCGEIVFKCSFATDLHKIDEYEFPEHKCGFYGIDSEWGSYEIDNVIAWMPLPEAYKAERSDKG